MKISKMIEAMSYIDDDLVYEAMSIYNIENYFLPHHCTNNKYCCNNDVLEQQQNRSAEADL